MNHVKLLIELGTLKEDPGNDVKLKMYALFKQVINLILNLIQFTEGNYY